MPFLAFSLTNTVILNVKKSMRGFLTELQCNSQGAGTEKALFNPLIQWSQEDSISCHCEQFLDIPNKMLAVSDPLLISSLSAHSTYLPHILEKHTPLCYYFV